MFRTRLGAERGAKEDRFMLDASPKFTKHLQHHMAESTKDDFGGHFKKDTVYITYTYI